MIFYGDEAAHAALARKPRYGTPCNSCGLCCMATLCKLAITVFGERPGPCPALMENDDGVSHRCGFVSESSAPYREAALFLIGAGDGCDARFNGEPRDEAFAARLDRRDEANAGRIAAALAMWTPR